MKTRLLHVAAVAFLSIIAAILQVFCIRGSWHRHEGTQIYLLLTLLLPMSPLSAHAIFAFIYRDSDHLPHDRTPVVWTVICGVLAMSLAIWTGLLPMSIMDPDVKVQTLRDALYMTLMLTCPLNLAYVLMYVALRKTALGARLASSLLLTAFTVILFVVMSIRNMEPIPVFYSG